MGAEQFVTSRGKPKLVDCAVLFLDLLGVSAMSGSTAASKHLNAIDRVVSRRYRDFLAPRSPWPAAFFSDTLLLCAPAPTREDRESAISGLVLQGAVLQLELALEGFFVRGGLAFGKFHLHNGLVFGPALVEAYRLESEHAIHPRVILGRGAERCQREAMAEYQIAQAAPQSSLLVCDDDSWTFVNYLGALFDEPDDPRGQLAAHRQMVTARLREHSKDRRRWEKYRWVAEYHNEVLEAELPDEPELLIAAEAMRWRFRPFSGQ
ncbi:MAG TPA: hypothetical protein VN618_02050 [Solirubrobacteraceae bacterium]|nr:hypothetical protein [Solirubrobacteraceae bacterium]